MNELEQAAMAYGAASSAVESASVCNAPDAVQSATKQDLVEALADLRFAALAYYLNHFDGAPNE